MSCYNRRNHILHRLLHQRTTTHPTLHSLVIYKSHLHDPGNKCNKEIKKAPSELSSYISTAAGFFKNTREVLEKHEPQASVSRTSRVFLKIPKCLYNSTMHEEQVSYFLYKIETQKQIPLLVLKLSNYKSNDVILHFFKLSPYR